MPFVLAMIVMQVFGARTANQEDWLYLPCCLRSNRSEGEMTVWMNTTG